MTNVTSLLKTVKAVEDEATKGTRALEATIEHIRQELAVSNYTLSMEMLCCQYLCQYLECFFTSLTSRIRCNQVPAESTALHTDPVSDTV